LISRKGAKSQRKKKGGQFLAELLFQFSSSSFFVASRLCAERAFSWD